ncbi:tRNA uracil 4-sulfurtransferase ThiI [Lactobacillus mulieris]|jgi:thiamine biosynthesis/tRNA modification protein thiI|uniref:Probable tRNA sulfurtransferase n=1 Tax=Lactobacillus mulieris TaxID=2508708 RepID=A0AAP3GYK6_9LACO|nr:tRNA uracil 4-sulfurtransferase ThiI [Lactobacillus mulieris]EEU21164.1 thiamine biosynthesis/tRNA modification protein ThiI [Lactobacillus jensenii 27-2-CHN]EEX24041.1 thiamine biosynthesis/tRNA modification protein ThiI [Lactobacillus jensenii 115-3-CHN]EFH29216.1 thiamine biosynthesis/tRNA modification protein ThiI [Lactobacillus jensenii JV-V16]KAA9245394.1 tRNA 4-thiouridine(8) synthase ThiI [Lactobacillus jensenii]KAA9368463.1 tRNA 4-thiouridine(8) synthase ThiI [Lactobacillus jenseni
MQYTEVMVRYGELSTKGKNRKDFIGRLAGNVEKVLADLENVKIYPKHDRMHIVLNGASFEEVDRRLKKVFGIQTYSPVIRTEKTLEAIKKTALEIMQAVYKSGMTFKVNTKRADHRFEYDTNQLNLMVGDYLFDNLPNPKVEMKHPDVVLRLEVRQDAVYISNQLLHGPGGMPVGTAGKAVMMLSGGIDSPVASYLALKRGVDIEMVHFFSPPYTSDKALAKAKELTGILANYCGKITFIAVPFAEIQETIKEKLPEGYLMTIQRRFMLRLADMIREKRKGLAIFNGESVGQVASQTLESMAAINNVTTTPVIRPVATMDKTEIIRLAEEIGTFDLSVMPFEDCCTIFAPPRPKTKPKIEKAIEYEKRLDVEGLLQRAMEGIEISTIKPNEKFIDDQTADQDLL